MVRSKRRRFLTREEIEAATPDELVMHFMPLAQSMADSWSKGCEDAVSDAYVGLVLAAQKYKSEKGPFAAWAVLWIKQSLTRGSSGQRDSIYLPAAVRSGRSEVLEARDRIKRANMDDPVSAQDIADYLGGSWTSRKVQRMLDVPVTRSYHNLPDDGDLEHLPALEDAHSSVEMERVENREIIRDIVSNHDLPSELCNSIESWLSMPESEKDLKVIARSIREHIAG